VTLSSDRLRLILLISLALNLFGLGVATAHWVRPRIAPPADGFTAGPGEAQGLAMLFRAAEVVGDPNNPRLRQLMDTHRQELTEHRNKVRATQQQVRSSLSAQPYDPQALELALSALRDETLSAQSAMHGALLEFARDLTPEQRAKLAERVARSGRSEGGPAKNRRGPKW
jgi:uncharacterized membrane protein